ncbi:MAG TPA: hypothetical protein VI757_07860, partial [Bacteroidia bacterium]|nr:hypothetical protein [Bacteroidia bacterium]
MKTFMKFHPLGTKSFLRKNIFRISAVVSAFFINSIDAAAQSVGDTINVQTFFFGSSQDSFFLFPP